MVYSLEFGTYRTADASRIRFITSIKMRCNDNTRIYDEDIAASEGPFSAVRLLFRHCSDRYYNI